MVQVKEFRDGRWVLVTYNDQTKREEGNEPTTAPNPNDPNEPKVNLTPGQYPASLGSNSGSDQSSSEDASVATTSPETSSTGSVSAPTNTAEPTTNTDGTSSTEAGPTSTADQPAVPTFDLSALTAAGTSQKLTGICQISSFNEQVQVGTNFTCDSLTSLVMQPPISTESPAASSSNSKDPGLIAGVAILAVLFAATLGLLAFFFLRRRKGRAPDTHGEIEHDHSYPLKAHDSPNSTPDQVASLQSQLATERRRINDLQAALLAQSTAPAGWSSAPAKDDRDVKRSFSQIFIDIKDLAGNYYRSKQPIGPHEITPEVTSILNECVDGWDGMLSDGKGRMLLVRVICGEILRRAWDEGEFLGKRVGKGFRVMEKEVTKNLTIQQAHLWRVQTIGPLLSTVDPKTRAEAVTVVATRIVTLLTPFAPTQNPASYIETIATTVSALYFELSTQNAFYSLQPYISISRPDAGEESAIFEVASCEDVEQKFETGRDQAGREWSQAEGARIRGFVFPAVVKYGDGRGGGWDSAVVVVYKAQVFM